MGSDTEKVSNVDLLIVGAGPSGMMAATWASRLGIKTRIVDKRGTKIFNGQADGLQCRSLEIFDSFGFADRAWKESNHMIEMCFWNPDANGQIRRSDRIADTIPGISRFHESVLTQGRIERFMLDALKEHSDIEVERGVLPEKLEIDESKVDDNDAYPITVTLRHLSDEEATPAQAISGSKVQDGLFRSSIAKDDTDDLIRKGQEVPGSSEVVRAKYMIGCDGAHSWTRRQLGFTMEGEQTDYIWGVLDIIPITDFPDIRSRCAVHSAESGSLMVIPRENKLVRLYIQLTEVVKEGGQVDRSKITPEQILKAAQKTIAPYKLDYQYCDWWTAYQIGQRVGTSFHAHSRVFLAGDAVHTHSPKAGQGMNVSMQDSYNLTWKIGLVTKNLAKRAILPTYQSERRRIAHDLIAFDHKFSRLFSGRPAIDEADAAGISMTEFKEVFKRGHFFASGLSVDYGASILIAKPGDAATQGDGTDVSSTSTRKIVGKQVLAQNIKLGMRIPSHKVLNQSDGRPWHLHERLPSDGRFRLVVFAGNIRSSTQMARYAALGKALSSPSSFLHRFTPKNAKIDSVIEVLTVHSAPRHDIELLDLPEIFHPFDEKTGWDYDKVFVDGMSYHEGHGEAYLNYGIESETGCLIVVRPDQYVAYVGELEDIEEVAEYFGGTLVEQK